jgi:hypothetical protein
MKFFYPRARPVTRSESNILVPPAHTQSPARAANKIPRRDPMLVPVSSAPMVAPRCRCRSPLYWRDDRGRWAMRPLRAATAHRRAGRGSRAPQDHCWPIQERMAREWVMTVPSGSLSAGSFVDPVASRSSSREPFRRKGIGLP